MQEGNHRIVVLGAHGMLGTELIDTLHQAHHSAKIIGLDLKHVDICKPDEVDTMFQEYQPTVIINCAAFTNVDACEDKKDTAFQINGYAPGIVAKACKKNNAKLIHISTDYVFDGNATSPISEDMPTNPKSVYGESKQLGESEIQKHADDYLIIRTSWLYGHHGKNFVHTMLQLSADPNRELKVVNDQIGSPTNVADLSLAISQLLDHKENKLLHFSNNGQCSWYDFTKKIFKLKHIKNKVTPVDSSQFPTKANRPKYSVLSLAKMERALGYTIKPWQDALADFFNQLATTSTANQK